MKTIEWQENKSKQILETSTSCCGLHAYIDYNEFFTNNNKVYVGNEEAILMDYITLEQRLNITNENDLNKLKELALELLRKNLLEYLNEINEFLN